MRAPGWGAIALAAALVVGAPTIGAGAARAAEPPPSDSSSASGRGEREAKARELFAVGQYREALALYGKLYADTAHPTYLRNIGRCYQNLREPDKAISSFEEYLRQAKGLSPEQRAVVEGYIREMDELKRKQQETADATATKPPPPTRTEARADTPAPRPAATAAVTVERAAPEQGRARPRRTAGLVVGGLAVAALGVGGVFGVLAIQKTHDSDQHCKERCDQIGYSLYQQAKTDARVADVAVGVGLAGAAVAAFLIFTSGSDDGPRADGAAASPRVRVVPSVGVASAGLSLGGTW